MRVARRHGNPADLFASEGPGLEQPEHRVERSMRAVAGRVFLDAEAVFDDAPLSTEPRGRGLTIDLAGRGDRVQKTLRMLERILRRGEPDFRETRRHQPGMRRPPGMEGFCH